jgi:hypothetical protein
MDIAIKPDFISHIGLHAFTQLLTCDLTLQSLRIRNNSRYISWETEGEKVAGFIRPRRIYASTRHRVHFLNDDHGGETF